VGIQLAWNLRPFLGDREKGFELFREYEGNFYAALIYSVNKLITGENKTDINTNSNDVQNKNQQPKLEF